MARIKLTAEQARDKWSRNLKGAAMDMQQGAENVTEAPGMKAAANADKWFAGITEAFQNGTWKSRVAKVSLEEWREKYIKKGIPRMTTGVDNAQTKTLDAFAKNFANIESALRKVDAMPANDFGQRVQRMVAYATAMHETKAKA